MDKFYTLHGAYYPNNFGDVLILAIQAKWIKELTGKSVALPYATDVYRESIECIPLRGVESINKSEKLVYGAGGYFGEPLVDKWSWGFHFFRKHFLPAEYAKGKKIKYAVIGVGVGPLTNVFTRKEIVRICKNASVLAVRDEESKEYLLQYGVPEDKINVTVDVALSLSKKDLPRMSMDKVDSIFSQVKGLKYGMHVGVDMESPIYGSQIKILVEESIRFFNENKDITPVLIIDNDNKQQNKAAKYLEERIETDCIIYKHEDIWETAALLSKLDVVLTNKLHVGIVSYALGTIAIGFPYHPKTIRFYKQIQQENLCTPILDIKPNSVYSVLNNSLREEWINEISEKRESIIPTLIEKSLMNKIYLKEFLLDYI